MSRLVVEHLCKSYPLPDAAPLDVLKEVSFSLGAGESLAVVGPSGSGKSTLLYLLGTLDRPTSGTVRYDGEDPFGLDSEALALFRNRRIGMIFQEHHLLPQLTVLENVLVPALASGRVTDELEHRGRDLLKRVGLEHRLSHLPGQLSGGEKQRVAVARALLHRPVVLLADEPTGSLDRATALRVAAMLIELQQQEQAALVTVTHTPALAEMMQRQVELLDGRLIDASTGTQTHSIP